jgi:hypothetical protein
VTSPFSHKTRHITENLEEVEEEEERAPDETDAGPLEHHVGAEDLADPREEE